MALQAVKKLALSTFGGLSVAGAACADIRELAAALDKVECRHVALDPRRSLEATSVQYMHLYKDSDVSIGIFVFPPSAQIPLHDHPCMTVLSRLLYGRVHIRSFDWLNADDAHIRNPRDPCLARLVCDEWRQAPATMNLRPRSGNIHAFTADSEHGCAILDVIAPPYDEDQDRDCHYFVESSVEPSQIRAAAGGSGGIGEEGKVDAEDATDSRTGAAAVSAGSSDTGAVETSAAGTATGAAAALRGGATDQYYVLTPHDFPFFGVDWAEYQGPALETQGEGRHASS